MKLYEIKPLLQDMGRNNAKIDKFQFTYNKVEFEVIVLIERSPFELLFGVIGYNYSFSLTLRAGYELQELPDEVFYKLCDILNLKPGRESLTSYKFLKYVAKRIPARYSKTKIQPHEIAKYKQRNIDDAHKIYFVVGSSMKAVKEMRRTLKRQKNGLVMKHMNFVREIISVLAGLILI